MLTLSYQAETSQGAQRLDHFLAAQLPAFSRSRLQDFVRAGDVRLNGEVVKPGARLRAGDRIDFTEPAPVAVAMQAEAIPLAVLLEDEDLLVINKPPGLVVHPAAGHWSGTVVHALLGHCGELSTIGGEHRPGIVHRLDKDTSGCLLVAKNDSAHQALARQFAGRSITKIYLALAGGRFLKTSGMIEASLGRHPVDRKKMAVVPAEKGRAARTGWRVLQVLESGTLVECTLHTGRTHQIRVHLQHLGHGLLGDGVYGRKAGFPRQMLHAWRLGFQHPRTGEAILCTAPVPADFLAAGVADPAAPAHGSKFST